MSLKVEFEVTEACIVAHVTGVQATNVAVEEFKTLLAQCRLHEASRVLVDFRAVEGPGYSTLEILYAASVSQLYRQHLQAGGLPIRLAYLGPQTFVGERQPGVELARSAGMEVILTTDPDEAMRWLAEDPAPDPGD